MHTSNNNFKIHEHKSTAFTGEIGISTIMIINLTLLSLQVIELDKNISTIIDSVISSINHFNVIDSYTIL